MKTIIIFLFCAFLLACTLAPEDSSGDTWNIHFLDVGQGLSVLFESNGKFALYDTGPDSIHFERILKSFNVDTLEWIVLSHLHRDHVGGFLEISQDSADFFIKHVFWNKDSSQYWLLDSIQKLLSIKEIPNSSLYKGEKIQFEGNSLNTLWPVPEKQLTENASSIVLHLKNGNESLLLTGDIEKEEEKNLLEFYPTLNASLFQVPHHGAETSSSLKFLETLQIQFAVVSNAKKNPYGHPAKETLKKLEAAIGQAKNIFRTDTLGSICFTWEFNVGIWPCQ